MPPAESLNRNECLVRCGRASAVCLGGACCGAMGGRGATGRRIVKGMRP